MKIINIRYSFLILAFAMPFLTACKKDEPFKLTQKIVYKGILTNLNPDHPRLLLTDERLKELKTQNTRWIYYRLNSFSFSSGSAEQAAPQKQNLGVKRLYAKTQATTGNATFIILLSPQWSGIESTFTPLIMPLSDW